MKRVCAIHDLSGFGKASLNIIIPVLSAMGIQTCPAPTAVLSTQTDGFENYSFLDLTQYLKQHLKHWRELKLDFDGIYTGFLGSHEQIEIITDYIDNTTTNNSIILIDPVLGDNGKLYSNMNTNMIKEMKKFIEKADIITPNYTEACYLLDREYRINNTKDNIIELIKAFKSIISSNVIITSVKIEDKFYNVCYDKNIDDIFFIEYELLDVKYPGTGDMFASILLGKLINGKDFTEASFITTNIMGQILKRSINDKNERREGIFLEKYLNIIKNEN